MPARDGTGPQGQGPMTGRGAGPCNTGSRPISRTPHGRGLGHRRGFGRGFGYGKNR